MSNVITTENQNIGNLGWLGGTASIEQIQAYIYATSYNPGDTITMYVSTASAGTTYSITIYRLGYYNGLGGRLMTQITGQVGVVQGSYNFSTLTLNNCPTAYSDATTKLLEAGWASSYSFVIPGNWITGIYLITFQDQNGYQWNAHFVLKGNSTADYAVMRAYMTDAAYNSWGGHSLYNATSQGGVAGYKVSFLRPSHNGGTTNLHTNDVAFVQWAESMGYNLSYLSDIDVHATSGVLNPYKAVLSLGHDEYWTFEKRAAFETAIARQQGIAFLGANDCYWQVRAEADHTGTLANKTITCYKVGSGSGAPYSQDPFYGVDNTRVGALWRDTLLNRPESSLIGQMFSMGTNGSNAGWTVDPSADTTYFAGTGIVRGNTYGTDVVGYEWDKIQTGSPANIKTIGTTAITGTGGADTANTTFYIAPSGALVFSTGSIDWTWGLTTYRRAGGATFNLAPAIPQIQQLMANIMGALKGPVYGKVGH